MAGRWLWSPSHFSGLVGQPHPGRWVAYAMRLHAAKSGKPDESVPESNVPDVLLQGSTACGALILQSLGMSWSPAPVSSNGIPMVNIFHTSNHKPPHIGGSQGYLLLRAVVPPC